MLRKPRSLEIAGRNNDATILDIRFLSSHSIQLPKIYDMYDAVCLYFRVACFLLVFICPWDAEAIRVETPSSLNAFV